MSLLKAINLFHLYVILAIYGIPQFFSFTTYTPYTFRSCSYLDSYNTCTPLFVPILSTWTSTAKHYIWFQLAVCGVECAISNFQGSVQREWCTRLSSHCAHHITTVSQHLSTAAKYSVQRCSGSHIHCDTAEGQQLSDHSIHYTTWWAGGCAYND